MTSSTILWLLLGMGPWMAIAAVAVVLGWGPAIVTLLANSRVARWAVIVAAIGWTLILAMARGRREGREEALAGVQEANAAARADRERIEGEVGRLSDEDVDRELQRWTR